ncbi:MAG: hypothetical protein FJZ95_11725 [Chloroflexi bacterium]|nr:hypothetical protein [Chloroflexota bacterium]
MYFRSTGLGKTELKGSIAGLQRQGDYLIMHVDVTDPVKWRIRAGLAFSDLGTLLRVMFRISILGFVLNPMQWFNKKPRHPGEF